MKFILNHLPMRKKKNSFITVVSGLPRSGTSMMMQMIEAGGMPVVTDHIRKPDENNPRGYYEFEKVKKIKENSAWLKDCQGRAIKIVSTLLYDLPPDKKYKVVFMRRKMEEILASQAAMLAQLGRKGADIGDGEMAERFFSHLQDLEVWLSKQKTIDVLDVFYSEVVMQPREHARRVNSFLGGRLDVEKMSGVVEDSLYRQKRPKASAGI